ncbi:MAG: hypothetical protein WBA24_09125 [Geitlerinemataceae cyanobacterium]
MSPEYLNIWMMEKIPQYIEQSDPGFQELTPEDFAVPEDSIEQQTLRMNLLREIVREFDRLKLDGQTCEFLAHSRGLGSDPATASLLDLRLFLDWLRRLEAR